VWEGERNRLSFGSFPPAGFMCTYVEEGNIQIHLISNLIVLKYFKKTLPRVSILKISS
jgi:hypothetical protein